MKVFYSDVDDTIATNSKLSKDLMYHIKDMNDIFIPCSGRPLISMKKMFKDLNVNYLIGFNGSQIYDVKREKLIFNQIIELKEVEKITKTLKDLKVDFLLYSENDVFSSDLNNEYAKVEAEICDIEIKKLDSLTSSPKVLGLCDPNKIDDVIITLKNKYKNLEIAKSKPFFIEITLKNVTKGNAILWLNENLEFKNEDVFCFGDSDNDISMFELNINKIAVANANENIKKRADYICDSCERDGVLKFLKEKDYE